jgi:hypothetical protein
MVRPVGLGRLWCWVSLCPGTFGRGDPWSRWVFCWRALYRFHYYEKKRLAASGTEGGALYFHQNQMTSAEQRFELAFGQLLTSCRLLPSTVGRL